jgi:ribosomal protein L24
VPSDCELRSLFGLISLSKTPFEYTKINGSIATMISQSGDMTMGDTIIREGDRVRVVKGKYASDRLATVVRCTSKFVHVRFEGCHETKMTKKTSVMLVENVEALTVKVQNLRIALSKAEAELEQKL